MSRTEPELIGIFEIPHGQLNELSDILVTKKTCLVEG